jgi:hypothetical protein
MDTEFGTWNVRTLYKAGSLKLLLHQIQQYQLKVTAIQEIKWLEKGIFLSCTVARKKVHMRQELLLSQIKQ